MEFKSLSDMDFKGKRVLLRADLNVPIHDGIVTDTIRIDRLKPTVDYLREAGAKVLVISHLGRPKGAPDPSLSLTCLLDILQERWGFAVKFANDSIGPEAQKMSETLQDGEVALLENIRFHKEETNNNFSFAKELAALGDIFVNDAFSAAHRSHASTEALAYILPSAAGFLMEAELTALTQALYKPEKPVMAVTGGSKVSTKLHVLYHLVERVDYLVLGGGMANTFLLAKEAEIGNSLCEPELIEEARKISIHARARGCEVILPIDVATVTKLEPNAEYEVVGATSIPADRSAVDLGPESIAYIKKRIGECKTLLWNGPLGVFEVKPFDTGTNALAEIVAEATASGKLKSIAGGGDTVAALENAGVADQFTYISTAGGAFLEWLEGKTLPGVAALCK